MQYYYIRVLDISMICILLIHFAHGPMAQIIATRFCGAHIIFPWGPMRPKRTGCGQEHVLSCMGPTTNVTSN